MMYLDANLKEKKARYDQEAVKLLKNDQILSRILKTCVREFRDMSLTEIIQSIEGVIHVRDTFVDPGMTKSAISESERSWFEGEGYVVFDVLFTAAAGKDHRIRLKIDLEAQNRFAPGYDLVSRAVFYCARMLSAEAETVFDLEDSEYRKIEKVYSIWICMKTPARYAGTISRYQMRSEDMIGVYNGPERYDLLEVVMVRLGKEISEKDSLLKMLGTVFSDHLTFLSKMDDLEKMGLEVKRDRKLQEGVKDMCSLAEGLIKETAEEVTKKVTRHNSIETAMYLLENMPEVTDEKICEAVGRNLSIEEIREMRKGKKLN